MNNYEGEYYNEKEGNKSLSVIDLFKILFPLGFLIGWIHFIILFSFIRWKAKSTSFIFFLESVIIFFIYLLLKPFNDLNFLSINLSNISGILTSLIKPYIFINILIIFFYSMFKFYYQINRLKNHPEEKYLTGIMNGYSFKEDIFDKLKKKRIIKGIKNGKYTDENKTAFGVIDEPTVLGVDNSGSVIIDDTITPVTRHLSDSYTGTLLTGGTGSGKTILELHLALQDIKAGRPVIIIDFKKSVDWVYLASLASRLGSPFYHFVNTSMGNYTNPIVKAQASYDPLENGTPTAKADLVLNMREWDSNADLYKQVTKHLLENIFYLLDQVTESEAPFIPWNRGWFAITSSASKVDNLLKLIEIVSNKLNTKINSGEIVANGFLSKKESLEELYNDLTNPRGSKEYIAQLNQISMMMGTLTISSYGDWLTKSEGVPHINLTDVLLSGQPCIILFQFDRREEQDTSEYLGKLILADFARASQKKNEMGIKYPISFYIDEFDSLPAEKIEQILAKVRSSQIATILSMQSLEQITLSATKGSNTTQSILDNVGNIIVLSGASGASAITYSETIGMADRIEGTRSGKINNKFLAKYKNPDENERLSFSFKRDYLIYPYKFQELSAPNKANGYKSTGYYITKSIADLSLVNKSKRTLARKIQIIADDEVIAGPTKEFIEAYSKGLNRSNKKENRTEKTLNLTKQNEETVELLPLKENIIKEEKETEAKSIELEIPNKSLANNIIKEKQVEVTKQIVTNTSARRLPKRNPLNKNLPSIDKSSETESQKEKLIVNNNYQKQIIKQKKELKKNTIKQEIDEIFN